MRAYMQRVFYWLTLLRQVLGEGEYERYRDHMRNKHPGVVPADPRDFYAVTKLLLMPSLSAYL